jgi:hypothetical protein
VLSELNCHLTNTTQLSVQHIKMKSVTIHKLYFPSNIILFENNWTLHHHLSKHVKIHCLCICKFTSRYKTYRWSCGHFVVAYWGRKWLAREIQFVKNVLWKRPMEIYLQTIARTHRAWNILTVSSSPISFMLFHKPVRQHDRSFPLMQMNSTYVSVLFCLWSEDTADSKILVCSLHTV